MNDYPEYKDYIIKKGNHSSGFHFNPNWDKMHFRIEVMFGYRCSYESFGDVDDYDINKLYGISWGMHHSNSYRIGWRPDYKGNIILSNYYYVDGERKYEDICVVPTDTNVTIEFDRGDILINTLVDSWKSKVDLDMSTSWGYTLYPYFGGNKTAPTDMIISLKVLR